MEQKKPFDLIPQPGTGLQQYYQEDEISLIDLWRILAGRKWLIFSILLACLVAGAVMTAVIHPLYESRAVISIGQISDVGQLEMPKNLVERLREAYRVGDKTEGPINPPFVSDVSMAKDGAGNIVVIKAQARTPEQARRFLEQVTAKLMKEHQQRYADIRQQLQSRLSALLRQQDNIHRETIDVDNRILALGDTNATLAATLTLQKANLLGQLPDVEDRINKLQLNLSSVQSTPTTLIRQPTLPDRAVKPKPLLYMTLATILGLIAGVFCAFTAEFLAKARAQLTPNEAERANEAERVRRVV